MSTNKDIRHGMIDAELSLNELCRMIEERSGEKTSASYFTRALDGRYHSEKSERALLEARKVLWEINGGGGVETNKRKENPELEKKIDKLGNRMVKRQFGEKTDKLKKEIVDEIKFAMLDAMPRMNEFTRLLAYEAALDLKTTLELFMSEEQIESYENIAQNRIYNGDGVYIVREARRLAEKQREKEEN